MATDLGKITTTLEGQYDPSITYGRLDLVTFEGSSYISKINNNNLPVTDSSAWQISALKGDEGGEGPAGPQGPAGTFIMYYNDDFDTL